MSWNRKFIIALGLIVILGLFLRFYRLGQVPVGLYWDEIAMYVDAKSIAATAKDMHGRNWLQTIFPSYGDYKLPVYIWFASLSFKLFGDSEWALRLPSAVAGIGTIIVSGLIAQALFKDDKKDKGKESKNKKYSYVIFLSTALVVAITPWSIMFSRTGFEGHLGQFILACSVLSLIKSKKSWLYLALSVFLGVLATYTYFSIRFVWPVVFLSYQVLFNVDFEKGTVIYKKSLKVLGRLTTKLFLIIAVPIAIFVLSLIPMTRADLYEASNQYRLSANSILNSIDYPVLSNELRGQAGNNSIDRIIFHRHYLLFRELLNNYSDHINLNFLFVTGDDNLRHGTGVHGLFLVSFLPFFILGWYFAVRKNVKIALMLLIWWLIAVLPAAVPEKTPHSLRSLNALVPLSIVIGLGIGESLLYLAGLKIKKLYQQVAIGFVIAALSINLVQFVHYYFIIYPVDSAFEWQAGFKELAQQTLLQHSQVDTTIIATNDSKFYLWLLAYGDYSLGKTQTWKSENFQFINGFDTFNFEFRDLDNKLKEGYTIQWVGLKSDSPITRENVEILSVKDISVPGGQEYQAVILRKIK